MGGRAAPRLRGSGRGSGPMTRTSRESRWAAATASRPVGPRWRAVGAAPGPTGRAGPTTCCPTASTCSSPSSASTSRPTPPSTVATAASGSHRAATAAWARGARWAAPAGGWTKGWRYSLSISCAHASQSTGPIVTAFRIRSNRIMKLGVWKPKPRTPFVQVLPHARNSQTFLTRTEIFYVIKKIIKFKCYRLSYLNFGQFWCLVVNGTISGTVVKFSGHHLHY